MNSIEALTYQTMLDHGLNAKEISLLVYFAQRGHGPSHRLLERSVNAPIHLTLPHEKGACPIEYSNYRYRMDGILYAKIQISKEMYWEDTQLFGDLPETLKSAIVGRPVREVIEAEALPADRITRESQDGALFEIDRATVPVAVPTLWERFAWRPRKWSLYFAEGMTSTVIPKRAIFLVGIVTLITAIIFIQRISAPSTGWYSMMITAGLALATLSNGWITLNSMRRQRFSFWAAGDAAAKHSKAIS